MNSDEFLDALRVRHKSFLLFNQEGRASLFQGANDNYVEISNIFGCSKAQLIEFLYKDNKGMERYYHTFHIPKKSGGTRQVTAPKWPIGKWQRRLCAIIEPFYVPSKPVMGYIKGKSVLDNATLHVNRRWVLNIDLEDFFGNITFPRIYGLFKSPPFRFSTQVAQCFAKLCTYEDKLTQGSPASPLISNMIAKRMDKRIERFASRIGCTYTRYSDDLTFSGDGRYPEELFSFDERRQKLDLGQDLLRIVRENGFSVNELKTRLLLKSSSRQVVTGLVVNEKVNINRKYVRNVRADLHKFKTGKSEKSKSTLNQLESKIAYLHHVRARSSPNDLLSLTLYKELYLILNKPLPDRLLDEESKIRLSLLSRLDNIGSITINVKRGEEYQNIVYDYLRLNQISVHEASDRMDGASEVDGAFWFGSSLFYLDMKYEFKKNGTPKSYATHYFGEIKSKLIGNYKSICIFANAYSQEDNDYLKRFCNDCTIIIWTTDEIRWLIAEPKYKYLEILQLKINHLAMLGEYCKDFRELV